jgi:hypothetical protein
MDFSILTPSVKQLAELAKEASVIDPISWDHLKITEEYAYELMASNVIEQLTNIPEDQRLVVAMATVTKLLVENFVLNIKLQEK